MNDDLHKDELDDFLQKNLSSFEENPPDSLWEGIEAGLPAARPSGFVLVKKYWWIAAAAAVLLGVLTCQHFYYRGRLDALQQQLARQNNSAAPKENPTVVRPADSANAASAPTLPTQAPQKQDAKTQNASPESPDPVHSKHLATGLNQPQPISASAAGSNRTAIEKKSKAGIQKPGLSNHLATALDQSQPKPAQEPVSPLHSNQTDLEKKQEPAESVVMDNHPANTGQVQAVKTALEIVEPIPSGRLTSLPTTPQKMNQPVLPIRPVKNHDRWAVQAHTAILAQHERITGLNSKPGPGGSKSFQEEQSSQGMAVYAGLGLERRISPNFSLLTGLDYQRVSLTAGHQAKLQFGDRDNDPHHGHGGPPKPHDHDFSYQLNTSSGPIQVTVRVSEVDSTLSIPDQEGVELDIRRKEVQQYLSIPLLAKFNLGQKRVHFQFKGGLLADILLKRDNTITEIQCLNPRLRIEQNTAPQTEHDGFKPVSLSYLASAAVAIDLTSRFSLQLEPMLIGGLTTRQTDSRISTSRTAAGMNLGLSLNF
ncbi:MAG: hypothetical protein H6574_08970 [Lewinellaceae bacterium]|nr:hypothetical protein [Saprospiraceae bacterium]MCB9331198.1 hypothetical protein [Lewinellaceae bacterium]